MHQRLYRVNGLTFSSKFDSGNLTSVRTSVNEKESELTFERFELEFSEDNESTEFTRAGKPSKSWFYFSVSGGHKGRRVEFVFHKCPRWRFFRKGYRAISRTKTEGFRLIPVFMETMRSEESREEEGEEDYKEEEEEDKPEDKDQHYYVATIQYEFKSNETVFFSTSFPYSLSDVYDSIGKYEKRIASFAGTSKLYYTRELLTRSLLGRRVELLTVTNRDEEDEKCQEREMKLDHLFPSEYSEKESRKILKEYETYETKMRGGFGLSEGQRPLLPLNPKPTILLTCRVHPGETPSQYLLDGAMSILLDPESSLGNKLRDHFVFKIIPVLNPDGVVLGHNRLDARGRNLNRCYSDPTHLSLPTVYAAKEIAKLAATRWNGHRAAMKEDDVDEKTRKGLEMELRRLYDSNRAQIKNVTSLNRVLTRHFLVERRAVLRPSVAQTKFWMKSEGIENNKGTIEFRHLCSYFEHFVRPHLVDEMSETAMSRSGLLAHIDFHAHANKTGIFMFGNSHVTESQRVQNALYPWILSRICPLFEFESCDFAAENMVSMSEGKSRLGTGRVAIYRATNAINVYTLETHFQHSKSEHVRNELDQYTPKHWHHVGQCAMIAFLDLCGIPYANRTDRLPKSLSDCRSAVQLLLRRMESVVSSSCGKKKKSSSGSKKKKKNLSKRQQGTCSNNIIGGRRSSSGDFISSSRSGSF